MSSAIAIQDLIKHYGTFLALHKINLNIAAGEFFGLLGPNGAGKTTLIKTLVGLARRSGGSVHIFGHDVERDYLTTKSFIGFAPQELNVDRYFTVRRLLEFQGGFFGLSRAKRSQRTEELIAQFELSEKLDVQFWRLSGGMQRRVMVARSMMAQPRILILDEPTAGVDVEQRHQLWGFLRGLNRDGTTIILTTHYIDEAEQLCERIGIIRGGEIIACASPQALIQEHCKQYFEVNGQRQTELAGHKVSEVKIHRGSLEEVFLKLTGHSIHEGELS